MFVNQLPDYIASSQPRRYIFLSNEGGYPWYELNPDGSKIYIESPAITGSLEGIQYRVTISEKYGSSEKIDFFFTHEGSRFALRTGLGTWGCRCLLAILIEMQSQGIPWNAPLIIVPKLGESNVVFVDCWVGQNRLKINAKDINGSAMCLSIAQDFSQYFPDVPFKHSDQKQTQDSTMAYSRDEVNRAIQEVQKPNYSTTATKGAKLAEGLSYDDLVNQLKDLRHQLGWEKEDVRVAMKQLFGKEQWGLLSDDEMLTFLKHLKSLVSGTVHDDWNYDNIPF